MYELIKRRRRAVFASLDEFLQSCGSSAHTTSCRDALNFLEEVTDVTFYSIMASQSSEGLRPSGLYDKNTLRTIFGLPASFDARLLWLLEVNGIKALVDYVHLLTLMIILDDIWFAGRISGMEIARISDAMEVREKKSNKHNPGTDTKLDWRTAMRWPTEMLKESRRSLE